MKKVCSIILAVMMVVGMIPLSTLTAFAADSVSYIDRTWDDAKKAVVSVEKTADATAITAGTTTLAGGWYYVDGNVGISSAVTVSGTADNPTCIILKDGAGLYAENGIIVESGKKLCIYGQAKDSGALTAGDNAHSAAGIGGGENGAGGTVTINGGTVFATSTFGAGIGGGRNGAGGTVTINGGTVSVETTAGAGIGGGERSAGGTVTINGGQVLARSSTGAGIGGGWRSAGGTVTINGGEVFAQSSDGAGIGGGDRGEGGTVTINGGTVEAISYSSVGIGAGRSSTSHGSLVVGSDVDVMKAGDSADEAEEKKLEDYLTARTKYVYLHTHDFTSYTDNDDGTHTGVCVCGATNTKAHTFEDGVCTYCGAEKPTHEHVFSTEWTTDETAHWHECTAEDCDIEDYATCGLEGAAYGAHVYDQEVVADRYLKSEAIYTRGGIYYMSCKCGACDKSDTAATFTDSENRSLSECFWKGVFEYGLQIGRQGKVGEDNSISTEAGRTIIPLTAEQLGEVGDCLTILANDGNGDFTLTVDCVYTYFYDVTDGTETKYEAGQGDLADFAAFIILDKKSNDSPLTGYGYFRVYNADTADEDYFMFDALYPSAVIE